MPTYEYECQNEKCELHKKFEVTQGIKDEKLTECPKCASELRKLISQSTFKLKGPGWAKDGY